VQPSPSNAATLVHHLYHFYVTKAQEGEAPPYPKHFNYKVKFLGTPEFSEAAQRMRAIADLIGKGLTTRKVGSGGSCRPLGGED
jgi:hypothetical protein